MIRSTITTGIGTILRSIIRSPVRSIFVIPDVSDGYMVGTVLVLCLESIIITNGRGMIIFVIIMFIIVVIVFLIVFIFEIIVISGVLLWFGRYGWSCPLVVRDDGWWYDPPFVQVVTTRTSTMTTTTTVAAVRSILDQVRVQTLCHDRDHDR
jgi:hypothetical protein